MCLACRPDIGAHGKNQIRSILKWKSKDGKWYTFKSRIHTFDNKIIYLNQKQINEIIQHALVVISTGVDLQNDIWAIQWPNDYKPKTL
jgi:hypothetical protein